MDRREHIKSLSLSIGYALSFGTLASIAESCKMGQSDSNTFTKNQLDLLNEYCETILPKTDSPGAKDTKCGAFIQKIVTEIYSKQDREAFIIGIDNLENTFTTKFGKSFLKANKKEQETFFTELDKTLPKFPPSMWGIILIKQEKPVGFFRNLKQATLLAYFTSNELSAFNMQKVSHG